MKSFLLFCFLLLPIAIAAPTKTTENGEDLNPMNVTEETKQTMIRQCACQESDECISEAYPSLKDCRKSCKSHLKYFGTETDDYVECWPKNPGGKNVLASCLKTNIPNFCASNSSTYIDKPDYNQTSTEEEDGINLEMAKHFKAFHYCAGACLKEKIVACYERKSCGVTIPQNYDIGKPANFCEDLKSTVTSNTMKAYACIAFSNFFG